MSIQLRRVQSLPGRIPTKNKEELKKKGKQFLSALLCAVLLLSCCVIPAAAVEENYGTFDYRAYANIYPDLKAAYGYDAQKLYARYVNYGKDEGRVGSFISGDNRPMPPSSAWSLALITAV